MNRQDPEIFGFSTSAVLELGGAINQLHVASGGRIGGEDSMLKEIMGLLPVIEQVQAGTTNPVALQMLSAIREQSAGLIARVEPYVGILAQFDNPQQTFVHEIGRVRDDVLDVAAEWRDDFGATEVANGFTEVVGQLIESPKEAAGKLPMLSEIVVARKSRPRPLKFPPAFILVGIVAPEMLTVLDAPLPEADQKPDIIDSVRRRPVPLTIVAKLLKGRELRALRTAAPVLLPRIRDLLPTESTEVTKRFEAVKEFLLA